MSYNFSGKTKSYFQAFLQRCCHKSGQREHDKGHK